MDYRKDNWDFELDCMRKAVNGGIDGYRIEISRHYDDERFESRGYTREDIGVAIFNGRIIEGYSSEHNRKRASRVSDLSAPSRIILGKDMIGAWIIVVVGLTSSRSFVVVTCFSPLKPRYLELIQKIENEWK